MIISPNIAQIQLKNAVPRFYTPIVKDYAIKLHSRYIITAALMYISHHRLVTHYFARPLGNCEISESLLVLHVADNTRVKTAR